MSWLSDRYDNWITTVGNVAKNMAPQGTYVQDFIQKEVLDKSSLRASELESVLSGLPIAGDIIKGVEGVNQLEDLYNNTGKVPQYPGSQNLGSAGLGKALGGITRKIEDGTHDLGNFYAGENVNNERMWRYMTENWNKRHNNYYLR